MEPNYLVVEALVQEAKRQRSQALGQMLASAWSKCKELLRPRGDAGQQAGVVWRTLPP